MKLFVSILFLLGSVWASAKNGSAILDSNLLLAYSDSGSKKFNSHLLTAYQPQQSRELASSKHLYSSLDSDSSGFFSDLNFRYIQIYGDEFFSPLFQVKFVAGGSYHVNSKLSMNVELASGGWYSAEYGSISFSDPKSFIGGVNGKPIWLQGVSASYAFNDRFMLNVGKFSTSPLYDKKNYSILWDEHISPEGIYGHYQREFLNRYNLDVKLSGFFVDAISPLITGYGAALLPSFERVDSKKYLSESSQKLINSSNRFMWSLSTNLLMQNTDYDFGFNAVYYSMPTKDMFVSSTYTTNSVLESAKTKQQSYKYNYSVLDLLVRMDIKNLRFKGVELSTPLSLSLNLIQNFGSGYINSASLETLGFVVGGVFGHQQNQQFNASYHYFRLPTDVAFSNYVDYDIGGTGYSGHRLALKYFLSDGVALGLKYTMRGKEISASDENKIDHLAFMDISIRI